MGHVLYFEWEIKLMELFQSFESPILTFLAKLFTILGEEYLMILILGLCYWSIKKDIGKKIALSTCGSLMFGTLIKGLVLRRRPYMDNKTIKCIRAAHPEEDITNPQLQGYSCPSLHASLSTSVYGTIFKNILNKTLRVICIILPILIGLSRIYLGVHYPTDVLLGWILGLLSIIFFSYIEKKYGYKKGFIALLIISALGFIYCTDSEFSAGFGVTIGIFLGLLYEEKYVNFKNTKNILGIILRPILGVIIFALVSILLKLPVMNITSQSYLLLIYRTFRYAISTFILIGLYPYLFSKLKILK